VPSLKLTVMSFASPITWLFVMTMPDASMTKPEPSELERRCWPGPWLGPWLGWFSPRRWLGWP
jgi:hypothetical protein